LKQFSFSALLNAVLPISGDQYWFARVYFGLYLIMPFLNLLIDKMDKKKHELCLVICVILFSLWRSCIPFATTLNSEGGNSIIWFIVLYLFGAYIKRYGNEYHKVYSHPLLFALVFITFAYVTKIVIGMLSQRIGIGEKGTSLFTEFTAFPMLFSAIFVLIWADKKKYIGIADTIISWFSSSAFSVYLIHENIYVKKILYPLIDVTKIANLPYIILLVVFSSVIIFTCCVLIDKASVSILLRCVNKRTFSERLQKKLDIILQENR